MKAVIARHCQTDWNARGRIQGVTDNELNEKGKVQASSLAASVSEKGITVVCTSDLKRAMQTGAIVAERLGVPSIVDARLRECDFGSLEGTSHMRFFLTSGPRNWPIWPNPLASDFSRFGGERASAVFERHRSVFDWLKSERGDDTVMIVGHGRGLRTFLVPLGYAHRFFRHGAHVVIDY